MSSLPSLSDDHVATKRRILTGEPLIGITRGELIESVHHVAACAVDASGDLVYALGELDVPIYLRSTAKPFIAAAVIAAGARERFDLEPQEIAVMAASHSGEPFHVEAVRSILRKIGLTESALQCGAHAPYNAAAASALGRDGIAPSPVHNNCSGKHAGILALCAIVDANPATYLDPRNPAQQRILAFCGRMSGAGLEDLPIGVDGCGIPVYAVTLRAAALSFMRLATLGGVEAQDADALRVVRDAMVQYPQYVSGTGEFDARLMQAANGAVACKGGAEGVHGTAVIDRGVGLACKIVDGSSRARAPAVITSLRRLKLLDDATLGALEDLEHPTIYNRVGRAVGTTISLV